MSFKLLLVQNEEVFLFANRNQNKKKVQEGDLDQHSETLYYNQHFVVSCTHMYLALMTYFK